LLFIGFAYFGLYNPKIAKKTFELYKLNKGVFVKKNRTHEKLVV